MKKLVQQKLQSQNLRTTGMFGVRYLTSYQVHEVVDHCEANQFVIINLLQKLIEYI